MEKERIGFIGLGIMGKRMAANLLAAGYPLVVRSSRDETRQFFASRKAAVVQTPEDVARLCDIIITMLPDSPEVKEVVFGTKGIFGAVRSGQVYIDMSSIDPASAREAAEKLAAEGVSMLDAPVSGGQEKAEDGTLSIMVGGKREVFERCLPLFRAMGRQVTYIGGSGAGQIAKLANQAIVAVNIAVVAEAMCLGKKAGVDPRRIFEAIRGGLAGSQCMTDKAPRMFSGDYTPGGKLVFHVKDFKNVLKAGREFDAALPLTNLVMEMMEELLKDGFSDIDHGGIAKWYEKKNHVSLISE